MSSQIPASISSPRKRGGRKGKRRSSNDDASRSRKSQCVKGDLDSTGTSKSAAVEHHNESQSALAAQEPRRSGRAGAGSGGRAQQLERVAALLEDRPTKSRQSTDLPEDTVANPLAPLPKSVKSGRSARKKDGLGGPPPPYAPAVPSQAQMGSDPSAPAPVFHQRTSEADRFGFIAPTPVLHSVSSFPPGTELNLQALNNPYVAARERQKEQQKLTSLPSPELSQQPPSLFGPPRPVSSRSPDTRSFPVHGASASSQMPASQAIDPSLLSNMIPQASHKVPTSSHGFENQCIDPVLLRDSYPSRKTHRYGTQVVEPSEKDEDSDSSSKSETSTQESRVSDEMETEHEGEWGATNSRQVSHPGFSREFPPSAPTRHASPPPDQDFDFQFSRDEHDENARCNLDYAESQSHGGTSDAPNHGRINVGHSTNHVEYQRNKAANDTEFRHDNAVDVLQQHHQANGRPSAPDPQALASVAPQPVGAPEAARTRAPRNSKKDKEAGPSPKNLGFYPSTWQDCLEAAKRECRVSHLLSSNPFPSKSHNLNTSITEALTTTISEWNNEGAVFEPGYWPSRKIDMACVLLGDMSTWRSDLKTTAFTVCPAAYNLIPPKETPSGGKAQWVRDSAARQLADSLFLRDGFDEQGKTNNFAHPALKEVAIQFFYTGSYRIADKRPNQFRNAMPLQCIALTGAAINCVLDGFEKNGLATLKTIPQFSAKEYRSTFLTMCKMLNEILRHPYHGRKLSKQLQKWGEEGWAALHHVNADVERDSHLQLVLD